LFGFLETFPKLSQCCHWSLWIFLGSDIKGPR